MSTRVSWVGVGRYGCFLVEKDGWRGSQRLLRWAKVSGTFLCSMWSGVAWEEPARSKRSCTLTMRVAVMLCKTRGYSASFQGVVMDCFCQTALSQGVWIKMWHGNLKGIRRICSSSEFGDAGGFLGENRLKE